MLGISYLITFIFSWLAKTKRFFWIWCAFLFCVFLCTSKTYADFDNYSTYYNMIGNSIDSVQYMEFPIGWLIINKIFYCIGLSYRGAIVLIIFLSCFLMHLFFDKFYCKESIIWGLFLIFPAVIQCIQIRFFLATAICVFGMNFLLSNKKYRTFKYIITVMIATLFHTGAMMLLIYCLIKPFEENNIKNPILCSVVGSILICVSLKVIKTFAAKFVPSMRFARYFGKYAEKSPMNRYFYVISLWLLSVILANYIKKYINNRNIIKITKLGENLEKTSNRLVIIISFTGLTIPFLFFDASFHRYFEVSYILVYILIAIWYSNSNVKTITKWFYICAFSCMVIFLTRIYYTWDTVLIPFFSFDGIFSLIR